MKTVEFFIDFASPFAYLANCRVPEIADKYGLDLVYRPIDLFAAKLAAGNNGPATVQIPPKFRYINKDLMRWADRYGVPFVMPFAPKPGSNEMPKKIEITPEMRDSTKAHKGMFFAQQQGKAREYAAKIFQATFGSGHLIGEEGILESVVKDLGWSSEEFFNFVDSDEASSLYEAENQDAQGRGVFGVPTMIIGDEMWWGNDRLILMDDYLAAQSAA